MNAFKKAAFVGVSLAASHVNAINITLDYSYDSSGFFSNPEAVATVEAAASFLSGILEDTFSEIRTPETYVGQLSTLTWSWEVRLFSQDTTPIVLPNPTIAEDEYRLYLRGTSIPGSAIGLGGPGSWAASTSTSGPGFYPDELAEIDAITDDFFGAIETRGEASGFASWGGDVTFDTSASWNLSHLALPSGSQNDLYSVAIHEMIHALGFGEDSPTRQTVWESLVSGANFTGASAMAEYGGPVPLSSDLSHWVEDTESIVYNDFLHQETALDPDILNGTRKELTTLDAAALSDIGWEVAAETKLPGDYNFDNVVDAADYTVWRDNRDGPTPIGSYAVWAANYGATASSASQTIPEPHGALVAVLAFGLLKRRGR